MAVSPWTKDRIDRLKTFWREGRTADWIARALGDDVTRSAVLGKVHRLGLSAGRPGQSAKAEPRSSSSTRAGRNLHVPAVATALTSPPAAGRATVLSVRRCECRWPLGDPLSATFSLCGRRVARGAYCEPHAGLAYRPARESSQTLEQLARLS